MKRWVVLIVVVVGLRHASAGPDAPLPDAAATLFAGTTQPVVPSVFGRLRFGLTERAARAAEPRLVAPAGSGDEIFVPVDGFDGAQLRRSYVHGERLTSLALRFDAPAHATLTALWGAPIMDGAAAIWLNPTKRVRAWLVGDVLTFSPYLPTPALLAVKSPFLGKTLPALRKQYGTVERDDQGYGLGYHLSEGPALEWETTATSVILLAATKSKVTGFYVSVRSPDHRWHESILAAARASFGAETSTTSATKGVETVETLVFERARAQIKIVLTARGDRVTFVEIRGSVR